MFSFLCQSQQINMECGPWARHWIRYNVLVTSVSKLPIIGIKNPFSSFSPTSYLCPKREKWRIWFSLFPLNLVLGMCVPVLPPVSKCWTSFSWVACYLCQLAIAGPLPHYQPHTSQWSFELVCVLDIGSHFPTIFPTLGLPLA